MQIKTVLPAGKFAGELDKFAPSVILRPHGTLRLSRKPWLSSWKQGHSHQPYDDARRAGRVAWRVPSRQPAVRLHRSRRRRQCPRKADGGYAQTHASAAFGTLLPRPFRAAFPGPPPVVVPRSRWITTPGHLVFTVSGSASEGDRRTSLVDARWRRAFSPSDHRLSPQPGWG